MESSTDILVNLHDNDDGGVNHVASTNLPGRKRARTQEQRTERYLEKYTLKPPCAPSCRKQCSTKFEEHHRENIRVSYWVMTFGDRRQWLDQHIRIEPIKQRKVIAAQTANQYRKQRSLKFALPSPDGDLVTVCKAMFMNTLGLNVDGIITEFVRSKARASSWSRSLTRDGRGRHCPRNKKDAEAIAEHINSYHPVVSHCIRGHSSTERYLDASLTVTGKFADKLYMYSLIASVLIYMGCLV